MGRTFLHWKELFWEHRLDLVRTLRCLVFGQATYESLRRPFRHLTAKAVLYGVTVNWLQQTLPWQLAEIDQRLAGELAAGEHLPANDFHPLPLMGLPGVTADRESAACYDDQWQFRPGRRAPGV